MIWTDVFQGFIMVVGLLTIVIRVSTLSNLSTVEPRYNGQPWGPIKVVSIKRWLF